MARPFTLSASPRAARLARITATALLSVLPLLAWAAPLSPVSPPMAVAGVDYEEISDGKPLVSKPGTIEVAEVFGYTCPHCANFEPVFQEWKAKQRNDVNVVQVPAPFGGYWIPYAQAFYAAQSMGLVDRTHRDLFRAIHEQHRLPIGNATPAEIATFYAEYGADPKKFAAAMTSKPVDAKLKAANDFLIRSGVEGTPSVIVAGKYRVTGKSASDVLRITDVLVSRERAAMSKPKK